MRKITFVVMLAVALAGCAARIVEMATIAPEDAQTRLAPRDKIHVLHKDRSFTPLIVTAVTDHEIIGEDDQVSLADVESISLIAEERYMGPATTEGIAWLGAIAIWISVLR